MKAVILDGYTENPGDLSWEALESLCDLTVYERTPYDKRIERCKDADILIVNKVPVDEELLSACPQIRYVCVLATGFNIIDAEAAKRHGVKVANIPTYGTDAVAQFAIAMLLEICHHVGHHSDAVHEGRWATSDDWCFWDYPLIELAGKTMGIIGFGRIGKATGRLARALGMDVIAHDTYANGQQEDWYSMVELEDIWNRSDVIALHCPLTETTNEIINRESISQMKDGVIILNNSRGPLINESDLADALNGGKVYAAGLDVVSEEPIRENNPLLKCDNCIITPHISWAPKESRQRLMDIAVENVRTFIEGNPANIVIG